MPHRIGADRACQCITFKLPLDGASNPEELVVRAETIGLSALALTDHDDLGGIVRFVTASKELELPAIVGAELTVEGDSHLILLAENLTGYKNLCYLIVRAHQRTFSATADVGSKLKDGTVNMNRQTAIDLFGQIRLSL